MRAKLEAGRSLERNAALADICFVLGQIKDQLHANYCIYIKYKKQAWDSCGLQTMENFLIRERMKALANAGISVSRYFWRTQAQHFLLALQIDTQDNVYRASIWSSKWVSLLWPFSNNWGSIKWRG